MEHILALTFLTPGGLWCRWLGRGRELFVRAGHPDRAFTDDARSLIGLPAAESLKPRPARGACDQNFAPQAALLFGLRLPLRLLGLGHEILDSPVGRPAGSGVGAGLTPEMKGALLAGEDVVLEKGKAKVTIRAKGMSFLVSEVEYDGKPVYYHEPLF